MAWRARNRPPRISPTRPVANKIGANSDLSQPESPSMSCRTPGWLYLLSLMASRTSVGWSSKMSQDFCLTVSSIVDRCARALTRTCSVFVKVLGEICIQLCCPAPQHGFRRRPASRAAMVLRRERTGQIVRDGKWNSDSSRTACVSVILVLVSPRLDAVVIDCPVLLPSCNLRFKPQLELVIVLNRSGVRKRSA
ncbi:hypothetical protein PHLGIDRAFT_155188, partial [Phlebiopsis gigantea 11061_1 CR5-6]